MSKTGELKLVATKKQGRTIISDCYYEGALKITRPIYVENQSPTVYLIHVGGGYVEGDEYRLKIDLTEDAHLILTTQAATKVYRCPNQEVRQTTEISLKRGSILEFFPDPLIAYEGAKYIQETTIHLAPEATLLFSDMISPGWSENGRLFQYDWISSKLKVYQQELLVVYDHLMLSKDIQPERLLIMEEYSYISSLFILNENISKDYMCELYHQLKSSSDTIRMGISLLPINGCLIRILGNSVGDIEKVISKAHHIVRSDLLKKEQVNWRKY